MEVLVENLTFLTWQQVLMWLIGGVLIYLAIVKEMEPSLLLPMGFGAILVNLPNSGAAGGSSPICFSSASRDMSCSRCCCSSASVP